MADLFGLTSLYILLGVLGAVAVLGAIIWAACCADDGNDAGSGTTEAVVPGDGKRQGLLNKGAIVITVPPGGQLGQQAPAAAAVDNNNSDDAALCAICKGRLMGPGVEGPCRRLRPCGHVYHAECIDLWLERKRICPLCRAGVILPLTETIDAMV